MEELISAKNLNPSLQVISSAHGKRTMLKLTGKIVYSNQAEAKKLLLPFFEVSEKTLILNLNQVDFMDSTGLATMIHLFKKSEANHCRFYIVSNNPIVNRILTIAKIHAVVPIYQSEEEIL